MPVYKFDVGNTADGPIGMVANIKDATPEKALERLRAMLPEAWDTDELYDLSPEGMEADEYIAVYFNSEAITTSDIAETLDSSEVE